MRTIADLDQYSLRVALRRDGKTWTWHILKAGRNQRAGKTLFNALYKGIAAKKTPKQLAKPRWLNLSKH
jgi:hypothetical protein